MKIFKTIIIFFILISWASANTIYNLIKIPNLEIYSLNSPSGIKYLKPYKAFQVGIRNNNVSCFDVKDGNIDKIFPLVDKNFKKYDETFLKKINLKYVVLCENLSVAGIGAAGVPNYLMKTLILDINFEKEYFERVLHHEIFHIINDNFKELFEEKEWINFNNKNFKYAECSTCSDKFGLSLFEKTNGFLTEYSMTTPSEDMAEIYSFMMTDKKLLKNVINKDSILENKVSYLKKKLMLIDENLKF